MDCDRRQLLTGTAAFGISAASLVGCDKTGPRAEGPADSTPAHPNGVTSFAATAAEVIAPVSCPYRDVGSARPE